MTLDNLIVLISIFTTPILIIASSVVIYILFNSFVRAKNSDQRTPVEWMIIGIVINFTGSIFDNLWWFIAWSYHYIDPSSEGKEFFFHYGVYSNTIFRQLFGIAGALCHIYAGTKQANIWHKSILYTGSILGLLQVIYLLLVSN